MIIMSKLNICIKSVSKHNSIISSDIMRNSLEMLKGKGRWLSNMNYPIGIEYALNAIIITSNTQILAAIDNIILIYIS